jgi:hypothetical protein
MFKGVSQCMPTVLVLYFGPLNLIHYSPLPLYFPPSIFQQFSIHILISSTFTSYVMWCYWCSIILFSFLSLPEFVGVVPLLHTCSASEFVYDHACFCVYVYLWFYLPRMRENMWLLCFWSWLIYSLNMTSSNCIHLPSNHMSLFLMVSNTPMCLYTTISWYFHQL